MGKKRYYFVFSSWRQEKICPAVRSNLPPFNSGLIYWAIPRNEHWTLEGEGPHGWLSKVLSPQISRSVEATRVIVASNEMGTSWSNLSQNKLLHCFSSIQTKVITRSCSLTINFAKENPPIFVVEFVAAKKNSVFYEFRWQRHCGVFTVRLPHWKEGGLGVPPRHDHNWALFNVDACASCHLSNYLQHHLHHKSWWGLHCHCFWSKLETLL